MKQSRKAWKPQVNDLQAFRDFILQERKGLKFIAHCYDEIEKKDLFEQLECLNTDEENVTVLIGPEGDSSVDEVRQAMANGYQSVSLGQSRLRTETAALAAVMMMQLKLRN